jgi:hypothetical protein
VTADEIIALLAAHHEKDVFVAQCKDGPTHVREHLRLDAWALDRSWRPVTAYGYEVKVSRQDFRSDSKWTGYLSVCHRFSFVCPAGVITPTDLPAGIGLVWVGRTGKLVFKIRSQRREPDPVRFNELLLYVVMCRSVIVAGMQEANRGELPETPESRLVRMREQAGLADRRRELASFVNRTTRARFEAMAERVYQAERMNERTEGMVEYLARHGVTWDPKDHRPWQARQDIDRVLGVISTVRLQDEATRLRRVLDGLIKEIQSVEQAARGRALPTTTKEGTG